MIAGFSKISSQKKHIAVIIGIFLLAILFETLQQFYYIKRFNLGQNVHFIELLKTQSYKWFVWLILSIPIIQFVKKEALKTTNYFKYGLLIFCLVLFCVIVIAIIQLLINQDLFSWSTFFNEYVTFFIFQKAPIYTLGYIAIAIITHFYFANERLQIEVEALSKLKTTNTKLYQELSKYVEDKASVLNIKIGNKRKIIPVNHITWIEADDYCVIVHTKKDHAYTMRSSLKSLENKLASNFLRVHRKAIVNMDLAKELKLTNTPKLILENNFEIPVSKSNLKSVKNFIT